MTSTEPLRAMLPATRPRSSRWPTRRSWIADPVLVLLLWTTVAVALAAGYSVGGDAGPVPFGERLAHFLPFYLIWAALTPLIVAACRAAARPARPWYTALAIHVFAAAAICVAQVVCYVPISLAVGQQWGSMPLAWHMSSALYRHLPGDLLTYGSVALLWTGADYRRRMLGALTQARLDALRAQLQPHFLFNSLQVATSLVRADPAAAEMMLERLGDFLRLVLRGDDRDLVPLRDELELLDHYLAIMRLRFQDRLEVAVSADASVLEAAVPRLLLQPLVENALQHGVGRRARGGRVGIVAARRGERLLIRVEDDGPGLAAQSGRDEPDADGVGLANTRARLRHLFCDDHTIHLTNTHSGGLCIEIQTPLLGVEANGAAAQRKRERISDA
jgi:two-component system, LytTR family, sensor kinase